MKIWILFAIPFLSLCMSASNEKYKQDKKECVDAFFLNITDLQKGGSFRNNELSAMFYTLLVSCVEAAKTEKNHGNFIPL